jgi:hypothetical protein
MEMALFRIPFQIKSNSREYENNVYFVNYEKLLNNQLIPRLPPKSVIAMWMLWDAVKDSADFQPPP